MVETAEQLNKKTSQRYSKRILDNVEEINNKYILPALENGNGGIILRRSMIIPESIDYFKSLGYGVLEEENNQIGIYWNVDTFEEARSKKKQNFILTVLKEFKAIVCVGIVAYVILRLAEQEAYQNMIVNIKGRDLLAWCVGATLIGVMFLLLWAGFKEVRKS